MTEIYLGASCLVAAGYIDYPLMAFHFGRAGHVPAGWIPLLYGLAMAADAVSALVFGRWFDRAGLRVLAASTLMSAFFAPLAFADGIAWVVGGTVLWGIGMGAQESIVRAAVAELAPAARRGTAYGLFNMAYGLAWFAESAMAGWLYSQSLTWLVTFSVLAQLGAVPVLWLSARPARPAFDERR